MRKGRFLMGKSAFFLRRDAVLTGIGQKVKLKAGVTPAAFSRASVC